MACGFSTIDSPTFDSTEIEFLGTELSIDVFVPETVDNHYWVGDMTLFMEAAAASAWNQVVGQSISFTNLPRGAWSTVSFVLSESQLAALQSDIPDVRFRIQSNSGTCNPSIYLDNLRFTGDAEERTTYHTSGSSDLNIVSSSVLTFDNVADWNANVSLSQDTSYVTEGTGSVSFTPTNWTLLESRELSTSELSSVSSVLNLDVYIPELPADPYWVGDIQLYVECPSAGLYNFFVGQESLNNRFDSEFNGVQFESISFELPSVVQEALEGAYDDCKFKFAMSVNPSWGTFRFDNGGFLQ